MTSRPSRALTGLYAALAAVALVGTQSALVAHLLDGGGVADAFTDVVATPMATFVTIDLLVVALAAVMLMVTETRRLGLPRLWLYLLLTFAVAVSVAFPLFLIERERHLARW